MLSYGDYKNDNKRGFNNMWSSDRHITHLYYLTSVSVLKELNMDDVDDDLAWQYGMVYNCPWKDCNTLVNQFTNQFRNVLYQYVLNKCLATLEEIGCFLCSVYQADVPTLGRVAKQFFNGVASRNDLKHMKSVNTQFDIDRWGYFDYRKIPLTTAVLNQVDVILSTGKLVKATSKVRGQYINDRYIGNLKVLCSQIADLEKMMVLNFNNLGNERIVTNFEHSYLRQDQVTALMELICTMLNNEYNTPFNIAQRDIHFDTIRTMTYMVSILLHTFYDGERVPEREEDMYRNAIETRRLYQYLPVVREYTDKSFAYLLRMPFEVPNREWNKNEPVRRNAVRPHSLEERYIVLWYKAFMNKISTTLRNSGDEDSNDGIVTG